MTRGASPAVVRQIESLFDGGSVVGLTDRQLLERFTNTADATREAAFAALVRRHGPMVLGLCHELVGDRQLAEDAFQAIFLVLARKARSIRNPELLGNWLYGVTLRAARKARVRLLRVRRREDGESMTHQALDSGPMPVGTVVARDQAEALHDEIGRLPVAFRLPVVLCYFEGLTVEEAAGQLKWPDGTVRSRLARARDKLRRGLTRRGVVLPVGVLLAGLTPRSASASISSALCDSVTRAAFKFAAGRAAGAISAPTMALAREVLRSMLIHELRFLAMTVLILGAVATGAGYRHELLANQDEPAKTPQVQKPSIVAKPDGVNEKAPPGRMIVAGRVLDPAGKPVAGVPVDIVGRHRQPWVFARDHVERHTLLGRGITDVDGQFRVEATRTSADGFFEVHALANAQGFGLGWATLNPDAGQPTTEIRLRPERSIRGKLVDVNGEPAAGVELRIWSVGQPTETTGMYDGVNMIGSQPPEGLRNWPRPVTTDAQGRFTLSGIGHGLTVGFDIRDARFADQTFRVKTDRADDPKPLTLAVQPATIVEGRVLTADTGEPIARAVVEVRSSQSEFELGSAAGTKCRANDQGRYMARVAPGNFYRARVFPPEGPPYLVTEHDFQWAKGAVKRETDIKLPRGVVIRGKVTERRTGRPLADASVQYIPAAGASDVSGFSAVVASNDDGSYQIVVRPGKGHLFVYGQTSDFILDVIGERALSSDRSGGQRYYAHAIIPYDLKAGDPPYEIAVALRPGVTIKGHVIGPDGQAVDHAAIISTLHFNYFHLNWRGDLTRHVRDGSFELHGLDAEKVTRVSFLDADHQWGATVELSGKQAAEELVVRLQPCGQARARFVGPDGKPIVNIFPHFDLLGTTGPHEETRDPKEQAMLAADAAYMPNLDRKHYWRGPLTDADGRIVLPDLIPGATYRISDTSDRDQIGVRVRKEFSVKSGETIDLGDLLIQKGGQQ